MTLYEILGMLILLLFIGFLFFIIYCNSFVLRKVGVILKLCESFQRGIFKRIDENRELLELLQSKVPEFLATHQWVEGWLESQDEFLVALAEVTGLGIKQSSGHPYPRPWPGTRPEAGRTKVKF